MERQATGMQGQQQIQEETEAVDASRQHQAGRGTTEEMKENGDTLRVTPEEIALAAAALEAKRDVEHTWRETTLPIEEAIQHLGLNATPQDLAPEVIALRSERSKHAATASQEKQKRQGAIAAGFLWMVVIVPTLWLCGLAVKGALHSNSGAMTKLPIQKLAVVADNVPVHIDADTLQKLALGDVEPEAVSVDTRIRDDSQSDTMFNNEWTIVKSKGILLVNGWATVEFALNISNDSTGALFSAPPDWIPKNNLIPVQVPVYRLEGQTLARYMPDGKATDSAANSVLLASNVVDTSTAIKALVNRDILYSAGGNFAAQAIANYSYASADVKDNVLELTGAATDVTMQKLAGDMATTTLQRFHLPYTVSNKVDLTKKDP